jgi:phage terminase small subunit
VKKNIRQNKAKQLEKAHSMTEANNIQNPTLQHYICPNCSAENSIPYQPIDDVYHFHYQIRCSECKRSLNRDFFTWLSTRGIRFQKVRPAGEPLEELPLEERPIIDFEEAVKELRPREQSFVFEYLKDFHVGKAAERSGYSKKTAPQIGAENLKKPHIAFALKCYFHRKVEKERKAIEDIVARLEAIGFTDLNEVISWTKDGLTFPVDADDLTPTQRAAIETIRFNENANGISVEVKMADRLGALKLLGQHLGMWQKTLKVEGSVLHETYEDKRRRLGLDKAHPKEILKKYLLNHKDKIESLPDKKE